MTSAPESRDATEAVERIVNRGGEADEVLQEVLDELQERGITYAAIQFVEEDELVPGPSVGERRQALHVPVRYEGAVVGELAVATDDEPFAERIATLISAYVLVGWDTSGEPWAP